MKNVLIIDDDEIFGESLKDQFLDHKIQARYMQDPKSTDWKYWDVYYDLILVDLRLQNLSGLNLIGDLRDKWTTSTIIMMTGFGTIATAVEAIKQGANEYITKPITYNKIIELIQKDSTNFPEAQEDVLSLDRVEREYIEHILVQEKGNISKAAEKLGLHRQSLQRKLKKWVPYK